MLYGCLTHTFVILLASIIICLLLFYLSPRCLGVLFILCIIKFRLLGYMALVEGFYKQYAGVERRTAMSSQWLEQCRPHKFPLRLEHQRQSPVPVQDPLFFSGRE